MHVLPKPISQYPWFIRLFFWKQKITYGKVLDPGLLWGRSPWIFATVAMLYGALDRKSSPIDPALRSLITVYVSHINHCSFCIDINSATLLKRGVSPEKIAALSQWQESELFSEAEKDVLEYTKKMTITGETIEASLMSRLKANFDDDTIVELTGLIAFQNLSTKFNNALDVPAQGFCQIPQKKT
jgi:AhpD family alkylhydroperoxidase